MPLLFAVIAVYSQSSWALSHLKLNMMTVTMWRFPLDPPPFSQTSVLLQSWKTQPSKVSLSVTQLASLTWGRLENLGIC